MNNCPTRGMSVVRGWMVVIVALLGGAEGWGASPEETIAGAARRVVKLYGAGGVRGLEAYQTGILVSPGGHIVTVLSTVLDSDSIDCVLDDGRRYPATLLGADPRRELAVLSIAGEDLPCYELPPPDQLPKESAGGVEPVARAAPAEPGLLVVQSRM